MAFKLSLIYAFFPLVLLSCFFRTVFALNYASFSSGDGNFKLQWTYNNDKLIFNMTCKTTGWCAVGFTTTASGRNMQNYDIAVGGVVSNTPYLDDYWSTSTVTPSKDTTQNLNLIKATEAGGYTTVDFDRDAMTGDNAKDVQFANNTQVWVVWAWHNSNDGNSALQKHSGKGVSSNKHNLIMEAMSTGIQPSTTTPVSSMSSVSSTGPPPTTKKSTSSSVESANGMFKLQWTYNNGKLIFNMTCKTTGWCAVGFTTSSDGRNMVNYDIAVGGVTSNTPYLDDYWSTTIGTPSKDPTQNLNLIKATEAGGHTNVEFERDAETGDDKDVQFKSNTEVWIAWALQSSVDGNAGLVKHSTTGVFPTKHNLIKEAGGTGPTPTTQNVASQAGPCVAVSAILALSAFVSSF